MQIFLSDMKDKEKICEQPWKIGDDDDWYREELYNGDTILDDWTCETLIAAVNKDIEDKLSVEEILTKYLKTHDV
tara:strand:+ start:795 stop:1019 length:225 start_codon:yes stop_codon:yes gene_type:complete